MKQTAIKKGPCNQQEPRNRNSRIESTTLPANQQQVLIRLLKPINGQMCLSIGSNQRWIILNLPGSKGILQALCQGANKGGGA